MWAIHWDSFIIMFLFEPQYIIKKVGIFLSEIYSFYGKIYKMRHIMDI